MVSHKVVVSLAWTCIIYDTFGFQPAPLRFTPSSSLQQIIPTATTLCSHNDGNDFQTEVIGYESPRLPSNMYAGIRSRSVENARSKDEGGIKFDMEDVALLAAPFVMALIASPSPAEAVTKIGEITLALPKAGPISTSVVAWLHSMGVFGSVGGLISERLLLKYDMALETEESFILADRIFIYSTLSLIFTGYLRISEYSKGWTFYENQPVFWLMMSLAATLGAIAFAPGTVLYKRDQIFRRGEILEPLPDLVVDRMSMIVNMELFLVTIIPLCANLMSRGVGRNVFGQGFQPMYGLIYVLWIGVTVLGFSKDTYDTILDQGGLPGYVGEVRGRRQNPWSISISSRSTRVSIISILL